MSIVTTAPMVDYKIHWLKMMSVPGESSRRWEARWNKWKGQRVILVTREIPNALQLRSDLYD